MNTPNNSHLKLLLIAGYFPPVRISTGSIRPWNISRCFIDLGWDVAVVTPKISVWDPKNLDDVENKQKILKESGIRMIYTGHQLKCLAPWRYRIPQSGPYYYAGGVLRVITRKLGVQNWAGWVPSALYSCRKLKPDDVDIIFATGAPFWGFEIAYQLSRRLNKPYVMDYRDLWTNDPWNPSSANWVTNQERRLINRSSAVTSVSQLSGMALSQKYHLVDKVYTITNGYDNDDLEKVECKEFDHFAIIVAGSLMPPLRTLSPLLKVLKSLANLPSPAKEWRFHYLGPNSDLAQEEVAKFGLENKSSIHGNLPRKDALSFIKGASLNVVLSVNKEEPTLEEQGVIPGKIYELIGLGAKILPIVAKGSGVEIIMRDVGIQSFAPNQTNEILEYILECMQGRSEIIRNADKYSWTSLSLELDRLLRSIIAARQFNNN